MELAASMPSMCQAPKNRQVQCQPAFLTSFLLRRAMSPYLLRCACSSCSIRNGPPRAELRASRIYGLLARLATKPGVKAS